MDPKSETQMDMLMHLPEFSSPYDGGLLFPTPPEEYYYATTATRNNNTMPLADLIDNNTPPPITPNWSSSSSSSSTLFTNLLPNSTTTISFGNNNPVPTTQGATSYGMNSTEKRNNSMAAMREMIFRIAAMQPVHIDPESVKPPKRRNVKISKDPQSVAARHRRERISERIRILQRLVPGGTKMDTASMLDEAIHYVKFLKTQLQSLQRASASPIPFPVPMSPYLPPPN